MREKSLSVHGDCGDFRGVLDVQSRHRIRQKYFSVHGEYDIRIWRLRQEYFAVYGKYTNRHKVKSLSRRIFAQNLKKSDPKSPHRT
jgi:hypothetical protein